MRTIVLVVVVNLGCSSPSLTVGSPEADTSVQGDGASDGARDSATSDTGTPADSSIKDAPAETSTDGGPSCAPGSFPTYDKGCTLDENCFLGMHQVDCCGSQVALSFNHAYALAFEAAEKAWVASCPKCGCPTKPPVDEAGKTGSSGFDAKCVANKCKSVAR